MTRLSRLTYTLLVLVIFSTAALSADQSVLRPPAGAKAALIVFEDMECPSCAITFPLLQQAASTYKIPLVHYDFPLAMHFWSFQAAVNARWFEVKSKKLAYDYRSFIFENQSQVTKDNLRKLTEQFAAQRKLTLPLFLDPKGELAAKVRADQAIGRSVGIQHTPTVYLVSNTAQGPTVLEFRDFNDLSTNLYTRIDEALKTARPSGGVKSTAGPSKKGAAASSRAE